MQPRPVWIITTRLEPQICGVGGYSWLLDQAWPDQNTERTFVVVDGANNSRSVLGRERIFEFGTDWAALERILATASAADLVIHYTGRGYSRLGCPWKLPGILRRWKAANPGARLAVFFHETPGDLPVISRHYIPNACNRAVVRGVARVADVVITNTTESVAILQQISGRNDIYNLPVPSNIQPVAGGRERDFRQFVVFGLPFGRWQTLQMFDTELKRWQQSGRLTQLHLIGPADSKFDKRTAHLVEKYPMPEGVVRHGFLPNDEVSRTLLGCGFALTPVNESNWSKSGSVMACLAHGCVMVAQLKAATEPLKWAVTPGQIEQVTEPELAERSEAERQWYRLNRDWKTLSARVCELLQGRSK